MLKKVVLYVPPLGDNYGMWVCMQPYLKGLLLMNACSVLPWKFMAVCVVYTCALPGIIIIAPCGI